MRCISNFTSTYVFIYGMTQRSLKRENSAAIHINGRLNILMFVNCSIFDDVWEIRSSVLHFFWYVQSKNPFPGIFYSAFFCSNCVSWLLWENVTHHSSRWRSLVSRVLKSVSKVSVVRPRLTLLSNFFLLNFTLGIIMDFLTKGWVKKKFIRIYPTIQELRVSEEMRANIALTFENTIVRIKLDLQL